jgi:hypothetical protein
MLVKQIFMFLIAPVVIHQVSEAWWWTNGVSTVDSARVNLRSANATHVDAQFFYARALPPQLYNHHLCCAGPDCLGDVMYFCRTFYGRCHYETLSCTMSKRWFTILYFAIVFTVHFIAVFGKLCRAWASL